MSPSRTLYPFAIALLAIAACSSDEPRLRTRSRVLAPALAVTGVSSPRPSARAQPGVSAAAPAERIELRFPSPYESAVAFPGSLIAADRESWRQRVPEAEVVSIESSSDGARQRALFYDSGSERPKPLLVVLHSWSAGYLQNAYIPYARFAVANDWVYLQPDFRGPNVRASATLSELAVQDVLDAVDWARASANVDDSRVYLLGYSAGAMMSLVLAGREPDRWAGVVAWVPVFDLVDWYEHARRRGARYARHIEVSCGGAPLPRSRAERECRWRSPIAHLHHAAGRTHVFIAHGLRDRLAPPSHAIAAFNALAAPQERIDERERALIVEERAVPGWLAGERTSSSDSFDALGRRAALERSSRGATLVLFDGEHDMLYRPGLRWLAAQRRAGADGLEPERVEVAWVGVGSDRGESLG